MKIRSGFVSNSSTTSFCIYGLRLNECSSEVRNKLREIGLEIFYGYDCTYAGRCFSEIKDEETGKQFKDNIKTKLQSVLGELSGNDLGIHEESYYDG